MTVLGNCLTDAWLSNCGGKAKGLYLLDSAGVNIPETLIIPSGLNIALYKKQIEDFCDKITHNYCNAKFAVRSSALTEDGAECSWAGMYDTLLNITSEKLYDCIQRMYSYTGTSRQQMYKEFSKSDDSSMNMGLVVQRMIEPDFAGVCFSVNPISGKDNEIVIELVSGLGEKLVSGEVTPQLIILDENGKCKYFECGDYPNDIIVNNEILKNFFSIIAYLKQTIMQDADIEFAIQNNIIYFLQIRHITKTYSVSV